MDTNTQQLVQIVVSLLVGAALPFVAEYLNTQWKLDGNKALALAGVLSAVLAVVAVALVAWLTNTLPTAFTPESLLPQFLVVYGVGQTTFQLIKDRLHWSGQAISNNPVG